MNRGRGERVCGEREVVVGARAPATVRASMTRTHLSRLLAVAAALVTVGCGEEPRVQDLRTEIAQATDSALAAAKEARGNLAGYVADGRKLAEELGARADRPARAISPNATVLRVIDGDTIEASVRAAQPTPRTLTARVRILGIDTPEVHGRTECAGQAASQALRALLPAGTPIRLEADEGHEPADRYGRQLAYLATENGADIGAAQLRAGLATTLFVGERLDRAALYTAIADEARVQRRGPVHQDCQGDFHRPLTGE
ncbi:hypothetical protein GKE82_23790 [Conexibacter sp. W3-3-2]|uniref:thermonuclease family protein n=1 Tax=Conexibacter sp. W3-3-2 TaxID=2675227 RepID=UPI0012B6CC3C|nr:thermonuclease family protein [Conexibacter sp. W3-3-2]MTD47229.1 hypothetical protein [Conexibacter sp. W3-3-2]